MKTEKALQIARQAKRDLRDLSRKARTYAMNSQTYQERKRIIFQRVEESKCPRWVLSEVIGYADCIRDGIEDDTAFGYEYRGKVYFVGHTKLTPNTDRLAEMIGWPAISKLPGASYWRHTVNEDGGPKLWHRVKEEK